MTPGYWDAFLPGKGNLEEPLVNHPPEIVDIRTMSIAHCKVYLGIPLFGDFPKEYKHLQTANEPHWQEAVRVVATERRAVVTAEGLSFRVPSWHSGHPWYRGQPSEPFNTEVIPELLAQGKADSLVDKIFQCAPRIEGWFAAKDAAEIGQRHEDVPFPTGGYGTMVVAEILSPPDAEGLVRAVMVMQLDQPELIPVFAKMAGGKPASAETLAKLVATVNNTGKSEYTKSRYDNGKCPKCQTTTLVLLAHGSDVDGSSLELSHPVFFICTCCVWIGECGVGPVEYANQEE